MSTYHPDCWELLKITSDEGTVHKIIAGWYGGFAGSNSWKISSGIKSVIEHEHHYELHQSSGSVYMCAKGERRMSSLMMGVFDNFTTQLDGKATLELLTDTLPTELVLEN